MDVECLSLSLGAGVLVVDCLIGPAQPGAEGK